MASIYINTTGGGFRLERESANPGDAAQQVWQEIQRGLPLVAAAARVNAEDPPPVPIVFNAAHVVAVVEN